MPTSPAGSSRRKLPLGDRSSTPSHHGRVRSHGAITSSLRGVSVASWSRAIRPTVLGFVIEWGMARFVAFLRAVNVGNRRVDMATAREVLAQLGYEDVGSYVNSGNLLFSATGKAADLEAAIRAALEDR